MMKWFTRIFATKTVETISVRRWDAASTDRLNKAHWQNVKGNSINQDLLDHHHTLCIRSLHEASTNPILEGVILTHLIAVVGKNGPSLQVVGDDNKWNAAAENIWEEWWANPDINRQLSGIDFIELWLRSFWTKGEYINQFTNDPDATGPIKFRIHAIDALRLKTPMSLVGAGDIVLGIRRTKTGKFLEYFIEDDTAGLIQVTFNHDTVLAKDINHVYRVLEAGQMRGVPWLASVLQVAADVRDYDDQVLDAARSAADQGVILHTDHPDSQFLLVNESTDIERRTIMTAPPGWKPFQMKPEQPTTSYTEYRRERLRELGRPVNMPGMQVNLDSSGHNYSSARFDGQGFVMSNDNLEGMIERKTLNILFDHVIREAVLNGILDARPAKTKSSWLWPKPPHVDPTKEAKADDIKLRNGSSSLIDICLARGIDIDTLVANHKKVKEKFEAAGMKYPLEELFSSLSSGTDNNDLIAEIMEKLDEEQTQKA